MSDQVPAPSPPLADELRKSFQRVVDEPIPPELLELLNKLE